MDVRVIGYRNSSTSTYDMTNTLAHMNQNYGTVRGSFQSFPDYLEQSYLINLLNVVIYNGSTPFGDRIMATL